LVAAWPPPRFYQQRLTQSSNQEAVEMRKVSISIIAGIALFGGVLSVHESNAGQPSPAPGQDQSLLDVSGFGQALSGDSLNALSGRKGVSTLDFMVTSASTTGTQDSNNLQVGRDGSLTTGNNSVSGGAFIGANGFATVIQNSGNQVLIQNDLIVNVSMH
jgi:hypothetical protein